MDDYVKRYDVRDMLHDEMGSWGYGEDEYTALLNANDKLFKIPAADVAPVVHGRWICVEIDTEQFFLCNKCKNKEYWESDFCPNCGAKMDGGGDHA